MKDKLQYFKIAKELNKDLKSELLEKKAHFRANENSFSLVSLSPKTPELGKSNLKTREKGMEALRSEEFASLKSPGRSTPEKSLQAWIISNAITNNYRLPFDENIRLITSELAFKNDEDVRVVNDILGYCEKDKQICVIELKSKRLMKELINQVKDFEDIILKRQSFFTELLSLYDYQNHSEFSKIKKIIVWPYADTKPKEEFKEKNIIEVAYTRYITTEDEERYTFTR